mgnify:CR=1 FL=1
MSDVIQYARVIEPCVYKNEFYEVDDIITGTEEEIEQHVHFGYAVPTEEVPVAEEVVEEQPAEEESAEEEIKKGKK